MDSPENQRNCATCGNSYLEIRDAWPQFPQCSLCYPTPAMQAEQHSHANVFRRYLQMAHNIIVTTVVAEDILAYSDMSRH